MPVSHYANWDLDDHLRYPSDLAPDDVLDMSRDTSNKQWGIGSLKQTYTGLTAYIYWSSLTGLPTAQGAIGYWVYRGTGTHRQVNVYQVKPGDTASRIQYGVTLTSGGDRTCFVKMWDDTDTLRVESYSSSIIVPVGWHYTALSWNWDGTSGTTEAYWNEDRWFNNTGFTYTRNSSTSRIYVDAGIVYNPNYDDAHIDDMTYYDTQKYTGATIVVPTGPEWTENKGVLRFGYPFGLTYGNTL